MNPWIDDLRAECGRSNQSAVAREMGYSPAAISQALKGKYAGRLDKVRDAFLRAYSRQGVACPLWGEITEATCLQHQAEPFNSGNPMRVRQFKACRACPNRKTDDRPNKETKQMLSEKLKSIQAVLSAHQASGEPIMPRLLSHMLANMADAIHQAEQMEEMPLELADHRLPVFTVAQFKNGAVNRYLESQSANRPAAISARHCGAVR